MAPAWTRTVRWAVCVPAIVLLSGLASGSAQAQTSSSGNVSFTVGADFSHAYFFRGIRQEREGFIAQPYADMNFRLYDNPDSQGLTGVNFSLGQWNSLHSGPSGSGRAEDDSRPRNMLAWYEADFFTGFALTIDNWETEITYTSYMSPNDSYGTVQEIALSLRMDDSGYLGTFSLSPHMLLAIETNGQADGGDSEGVYLELGVEPGLDVIDGVASVAFPVTVGLSLTDYYENGVAADDPLGFSDRFGYFDIGAAVSVPLPMMPESYGSWELSGSFHFISLGAYLESLNDDDNVQAIGAFGVSIGY